MGKFIHTLRICATLFMARTFGEYHHTVWNGSFHYAVYAWRGALWCVPVSEMEVE